MFSKTFCSHVPSKMGVLECGLLAYIAFGAIQLFFLFQITWAIWIAGLAPTIGMVANILPFFLVSMEAFNGSLM